MTSRCCMVFPFIAILKHAINSQFNVVRTSTPKLGSILWFASLLLGGFIDSHLMAGEPPSAGGFDLQAELQSGVTGQVRRATAPVQHFSGLSAEQVQARAAQ